MNEASFADGIQRIAIERRRQIDQEGYTPEHDADHLVGDFTAAANCYLLSAFRQISPTCGWTSTMVDDMVFEGGPGTIFWPWDSGDWKPKDGLRDLVRAGALIAAEIDRLLLDENI